MIIRGKEKEEGQSTVEFALTLILLMGFIFFFLQLSLVFGFGNYVHYATFMSARAYLAAGPNGDDQVSRAKSVIVSTLKAGPSREGMDRFPGIARAVGGDGPVTGMELDSPEFHKGDRDSSWLQGVRYTFKSRLFLLPLGGRSPASGSSGNSLTLTSESWLGREPSDADCARQLMERNGGLVIYDNGC
jgi:hypothetical protein